MVIKNLVICFEDEGYVECLLEDETKIDVSFDMLFKQIKKENKKLFKAINQYDSYDEGIELMTWMGLDISSFLVNYLTNLKTKNGGTLKDLVWTKDQNGKWVTKL